MDHPPLLTISKYSLSYATPAGPLRVLDGIDLAIGRGEVVGLVGESGSGKSSLAYAILRGMPGRVARETGSITFDGEDLTGLAGNALRQIRGDRIAMVFQNAATALNPTQTLGSHVEEVLLLHRDMDPADATKRALELFEMVGLPDARSMLSRYAHQVSGGEKQRVVLAMTFACDPDLILFDEPTSALDATTAATLLDLFRSLQERTNVSALFISHDLSVIADIAHKVAVIYGGRIVEEAETEDLFRSPRHPYTRSLLESLPKPSDDAGSRQLVALAGPGPLRLGLPPSCVFSARCPFAKEVCEIAPVRIDNEEDHATACVRWQETANVPLASFEDSETIAAPGPASVLAIDEVDVKIGRPGFFSSLIGKAPGAIHAVSHVTLSLREGETLGLVGESGCGKSSLARALVGLRGFTGTVRLDDDLVATGGVVSQAYKEKIQIIFQNPDSSLNPRQKIGEILDRPLVLYRKSLDRQGRRAAVLDLLDRVRLPPAFTDRYPHELSGGEKQRVAIARAIAAQPSVIVCDEITSGLDVSVQSTIIELIREIQAETGVALLFITHDLGVLRQVAHRVAVMYLGEIIEERAVADIGEPAYHPYTEALLSSVPSVDPSIEVRRIRLKGTLPTRTVQAKGCPFDSRCPRRIGDICSTKRPPDRRFKDDHLILCHLSNDDLLAIPPIWLPLADNQETQT